jgi:hypothetical protein
VDASEWFAGRIPAHWGAQALEVLSDADEMLVVVDLDEKAPGVDAFRDQTREERMVLAAAAEAAFRIKVSWGARKGQELAVFTTASVPVMTRLRLPERRVLDTLIDAGLARTRSEALAWCVRLVGEHEGDWLAELRGAFAAVEEVRRKGPRSRRT